MDHSSSLDRSSSQSLSLASSLERMELEHHDEHEHDEEPSLFHNDDDAEYGYGEDQQLFGGGGSSASSRGDRGNNKSGNCQGGGIDRIRSEHCCSRGHLPKSYVGRSIMAISVACNVFFLVRSVRTDATTHQSGMPSLPLVVDSSNDHSADCATALSTFPNSGTTWTQAVFTSATGIASLAVYPEGPLSPFQPKSYVHGQIGPTSRLPDPARGECLFVKTHHRIPYGSLADNHPLQRYQRAVVLYREPEDNLHSNLRYLTKVRNDHKRELLNVCSYDPHGTPLPEDTNFEDWYSINATDYADLIDLHRLAHKRFYCHAERYPAPTMMVTYARLLSDPRGTFRDILTFSGYADADIDRALEEHPPRSHEVHGSLDYVPVDLGQEEQEEGDNFDEDDPCAGMSRRYQKLWTKASPCVKAAAKMLQFS